MQALSLKENGLQANTHFCEIENPPHNMCYVLQTQKLPTLEASVWWHYAKWSGEGELHLLWVVCKSFYQIAHRFRDPFLLFIMENFKCAKVDKKYNKSPCSLHPDFTSINSDNLIWSRLLPTFPIILFQSPSQTVLNFTHKDFSMCL